jgi:hypothetical protein
MHLTCNKFNVHGVAHMKHVPSMSPLHKKNNHCQIGLLLPPMKGHGPFVSRYIFLRQKKK